MKISANGGDSIRKVCPQGTHIGRCYQIIDLGTTEDKKFGGRKRKVQLLFELPLETAVFDESKGEQPYYVRTSMTASMSEKANLRKFIESWIGKTMTDKEASQIELFDLIGKAGMINVSHRVTDSGTYANIMSISPLPKGIECPAPVNQPLCYDTTMHNQDVFAQLPEFVRLQIMESDEYKSRVLDNISKESPLVPIPQVQHNKVDDDLVKDLDDIFGSSTFTSNQSPF